MTRIESTRARSSSARGLEMLVRASLESVQAGGVLDVATASRAVAFELPAWARRAGHEQVGERSDGERFVVAHPARRPRDGARGRAARRSASRRSSTAGLRTRLRRLEPVARDADPSAGLVPLGAVAEAGGPAVRLARSTSATGSGRTSSRCSPSAPPVRSGTRPRDIPWEAAAGLPAHVERGGRPGDDVHRPERVRRALRAVPVPPAGEPALCRGAAVAREPRPRRGAACRGLHEARARGRRARYALASTELSLHTLLDERDFSAAALLLNVLGEGTFLDLLSFVDTTRPTPRPPQRRGSRTGTSGGTSSSGSPTSATGSRCGPEERDGSSPPPRRVRRS